MSDMTIDSRNDYTKAEQEVDEINGTNPGQAWLVEVWPGSELMELGELFIVWREDGDEVARNDRLNDGWGEGCWGVIYP